MGLLISRFRRKKNTRDTLELLEKKIKTAEQYGHSTELRRKRLIGNLMVVSVGLYVLASLLAYLYFRPGGWKDGLLYSTPLLVFPIVVIALRTGLTRYYNWKLRRSRDSLQDMRSEKKRLLEEVMDTETYKVAKELLDKFGSTDITINNSPSNSVAIPGKGLLPSSNLLATPGQVRQRQIGQMGPKDSPNQMALMGSPARTPVLTAAFPGQLKPLESDQLPRPILGSSGASGAGAFDRLVDYLVGDGPGSRFALICSHCKGHNGMAMPEEFEYVSYRCAYCRFLNPARKQRPKPPPLMSANTPLNSINRYPMNSGANSESEDSDRERKSFRGSNPNISSQSVSPLSQSPEGKPSEVSSNDEETLQQDVEKPDVVNHQAGEEEEVTSPPAEEATKDEEAKKQD